MIARLSLAALAVMAGLSSALADPARLGTTGTFRSFAWAHCDAPPQDTMKGACDPAPVDPSITGSAAAYAHIRRGLSLIGFGRLEEARKAADAAVAADTKSVDALAFRARVLLSLMRAEDAERDLNAGLLIAPSHPVLLGSRAEVLFNRAKYPDALQDATAALKKTPHDADILWIRSRVYAVTGDLRNALADLDAAVKAEPQDRRTRTFRAQIRLRAGRLEGALEDANALLATSRGNSTAMEVRLTALSGLGRHNEVIEVMNELLGPPGEPTTAVTVRHYRELLLRRAILLTQLGRKEETVKDIDTLLSAGGKQAVLRIQLYLRQQGFPDVKIDGERNAGFDSALHVCLINQACLRGINWPI